MKITCPYCRAESNMAVTQRTQRFKCDTCGSRVIVDVRVKRGGKSAALKRNADELERLQREPKDRLIAEPGCTCLASNIRVKSNAHGYYADHTIGCMLSTDPEGASEAVEVAVERLQELHDLDEPGRWSRANELWERRAERQAIPSGDRESDRRGWTRALVYHVARLLREAPAS